MGDGHSALYAELSLDRRKNFVHYQQGLTGIIEEGSAGEIPPVPVIVGISATPERFNNLIVGTGRMSRPVDVAVEDVRASGLIKETIVLHHPKKQQPTDMTMLREAARSLKASTAKWAAYCAAQEEFEVVPLLVVQVEDSPGARLASVVKTAWR